MKKNLLSLFFILGLFSHSTLFAQPANDNCADAEVVIDGDNQPFSTFNATTDGADHLDNCTSTGTTPGTTYNDVWYLYTPTFSGQAIWSFCSTASFDTKIFVYDGNAACPPADGDIVACSEDEGGCDGATSEVIFDVLEGETYRLRVGGYGDGAPGALGSGTFNLGLYTPPVGPPNNDCENAEPIGFVLNYPFDNDGATTDGPEHPGNPCFGFGDNTVQADIWYSFTAPTTGTAEWSTCNMTTLDTRMAVYTGTGTCPYEDGDLYACNDDGGGCASFTSYLLFDIVEGETYLLRLGGFNGDDGEGTMSLQEIIPPEPPVNDLCEEPSDAFIISVTQADNFEGLIYGSTIASSFDSDQFIFPKCITNTNGGEFGDVWYTFNSNGNTEIEVRFNSDTPEAQFYFDLWDDCDTTATYEFIMNDCMFFDGSLGASFFRDTILSVPDIPTDYYIRVSTRFTSDTPGDFWFQLVGDNPTPNAVKELAVEELSFFPNPVTEQATLKFNLLERGAVDFEISNILGQKLLRQNKGTLSAGNHTFPVSLAAFDPGVYILSIRMDDKITSLKIVKE